jgi:cobalamin biosynthesis protein CobD/CbiB
MRKHVYADSWPDAMPLASCSAVLHVKMAKKIAYHDQGELQ